MRALIAMSGGVDSSAAAKLAIDMGYSCIGCTMWLCQDFDPADAKSVAGRLGMPFYIFDWREEFQSSVVAPFASEYLHGRTPNPCVECNSSMKFGRLLQEALALGCDKIVTGHYARIEQRDGKFLLKKAADPAKDQSYFLYKLTQEQLSRTLFPLGGMTKAEARALAEVNGFVNANRRDSQDICFVPDGDYVGVVEGVGGACPEGDFVDIDGKTIGRHRGIIRYTIGQHKGLGGNFADRMYVLSVNPDENTVTLGTEEHLFSRELIAESFNWQSGEIPSGEIRCLAKIRYRHREQPAAAIPLENGRVRIVFDEPQRAITPGQSAVIYGLDGETVLGGGIITGEGLGL